MAVYAMQVWALHTVAAHQLHLLLLLLFDLYGRAMQVRALLIYSRRIYHPCIQQQPTVHTVPCGLVMLWTHS